MFKYETNSSYPFVMTHPDNVVEYFLLLRTKDVDTTLLFLISR